MISIDFRVGSIPIFTCYAEAAFSHWFWLVVGWLAGCETEAKKLWFFKVFQHFYVLQPSAKLNARTHGGRCLSKVLLVENFHRTSVHQVNMHYIQCAKMLTLTYNATYLDCLDPCVHVIFAAFVTT